MLQYASDDMHRNPAFGYRDVNNASEIVALSLSVLR